MTERFLDVARFYWPAEADLARARLEAEGITVFLADENVSTWFPQYAAAVGGISLRVPEADLEHARSILFGDHASGLEAGRPEGKVACPKCGSEDTCLARFPSRLYAWAAAALAIATVVAVVVGFLLPALLMVAVLLLGPLRRVARYRACRLCVHRWPLDHEPDRET